MPILTALSLVSCLVVFAVPKRLLSSCRLASWKVAGKQELKRAIGTSIITMSIGLTKFPEMIKTEEHSGWHKILTAKVLCLAISELYDADQAYNGDDCHAALCEL